MFNNEMMNLEGQNPILNKLLHPISFKSFISLLCHIATQLFHFELVNEADRSYKALS